MKAGEQDVAWRWDEFQADPLAARHALVEVLCTPGDRSEADFRWFCGAGRELCAGQCDGRWKQIDYVFPEQAGGGDGRFEPLLALHWREGQPVRVWRITKDAGAADDAPCLFPAAELQQLDHVLHYLPHSLWARLVKLALDAHFLGPFPQRRVEPRVERRTSLRLPPELLPAARW